MINYTNRMTAILHARGTWYGKGVISADRARVAIKKQAYRRTV